MNVTKKPIVSVVMPSYNHARFIGDAVRSVLSQTFRDFELIIVDNHSGDGTDAVLGDFSDARLRILKFHNHGIIAASRNHGLRNSSGKFVAFIDSDDVWLPAKLEAQVASMENAPEAVLSYSRFRLLEESGEGNTVLPRNGRYFSGTVFRQLYLTPFVACSGVLARREAVNDAGGFSERPELLAVEDMDLWLRLSLRGGVICASEEPLFLYRVHSSNASGNLAGTIKRTFALARKFYEQAGPALFLRKMARSITSILYKRVFGAGN